MDRWRQFMKTAENDDWTRMSDAQARKRAQNRLAQRAHRKRQQQRMNKDDTISAADEILGSQKDISHAVITTATRRDPSSSSEHEQADTPTGNFPVQSSSKHATARNQQYPLMTLTGLSSFTAMMTNAHILHIDCETSPRTKMIYVSPALPTPPALTPTSLQSSQPHLPYVDLLPFSSLRDNLLRAENMIVAPELWSDIVGGGIQVWGQTPWDIRGWEVQESFATKWWWLMTAEVLTEANFWRVSRGEDPLILEDIKSSLTRPLLSVK